MTEIPYYSAKADDYICEVLEPKRKGSSLTDEEYTLIVGNIRGFAVWMEAQKQDGAPHRRRRGQMKRHTRSKAVGVLTVHGVGKMTATDRKWVADWLRKQARDLMRDGDDYAPVMRARLWP